MVRKPVNKDELSRREQTLIQKYGSAEKLAAKRREWQAKSRVTYVANGATGGLRALSVERRKEISKLGTDARKHG